eukprot:9377-Heterococcus_DN1.PRE.4
MLTTANVQHFTATTGCPTTAHTNSMRAQCASAAAAVASTATCRSAAHPGVHVHVPVQHCRTVPSCTTVVVCCARRPQ